MENRRGRCRRRLVDDVIDFPGEGIVYDAVFPPRHQLKIQAVENNFPSVVEYDGGVVMFSGECLGDLVIEIGNHSLDPFPEKNPGYRVVKQDCGGCGNGKNEDFPHRIPPLFFS
jgi:hypothetical protein